MEKKVGVGVRGDGMGNWHKVSQFSWVEMHSRDVGVPPVKERGVHSYIEERGEVAWQD